MYFSDLTIYFSFPYMHRLVCANIQCVQYLYGASDDFEVGGWGLEGGQKSLTKKLPKAFIDQSLKELIYQNERNPTFL